MNIPFDKTGVAVPQTFDTFGCKVFKENADTPDRLRPDIVVRRKFFGSGEVVMPDGARVRVWGFDDPGSLLRNQYPSPPIRVRQGQIVHTEFSAGKGSHTIHHHGIEPSTFNDGVGHVSFEVTGNYTYQWYAGLAGTHFYHCHKNTVLHFKMGMYGLLIIDPPNGPGRAFEGGPAYDAEMAWVADDIDPRWHNLNHDAGLCGDDPGLNVHTAKYFLVNGVPAPRTHDDPRVKIRIARGQSLLVRLLNASYGLLRTTIAGLDATVVGIDGRPLGAPDSPWSRPYTIRAGEPFELNTAQRYDLILSPRQPGRYEVRFDYLDWIRKEIKDGGRGTAKTVIEAT